MSTFDNLRDDAEKLAREHPQEAEKAVDEAVRRGGDAVDEATGHRFDDEVSKGEQAAEQRIEEGLQ
ncbi:MAG TPA: antitoxin [Kineosporiaceae bacterium]|nr:antitoxin [Kineosporiaceae bacterium]